LYNCALTTETYVERIDFDRN